jgi:hypothetical protein
MPKICERCGKAFRDNFDLNRHNLRKKPCIKNIIKNDKSVKTDTSGNNVTIINNVTNNITNNINIINIFGNEDLSHIDPEQIIDKLRELNRIKDEDYNKAGKLVISFHGFVNKNENNHNLILPNIQSKFVKVKTTEGIILQPIEETVDNFMKVRAGQLVTFKDKINENNEKVFQSEKSRRTWKNIESFGKDGMKHTFTYNDTRQMKTNVKVNLDDMRRKVLHPKLIDDNCKVIKWWQ